MRHAILIARVVGLLVALALAVTLWAGHSPEAKAAGSSGHWEPGVVYVENNAPGWPVRRVAEKLDNGLNLDLRVVRKCPEEFRCISVRSVRSIGGNTIGRANVWHFTNSGRTAKVEVLLETKWGNKATKKQRRGLVCHELGHALGLKHSNKKNTCMKQGASKRRPASINKKERRLLKNWY